MWASGVRTNPAKKNLALEMNKLPILIITIILFQNTAFAKIGKTLGDNSKLYGNEISSVDYCEDKKIYTGKKIYQFPSFGWQLESIYKNGK